MDVVFYKNSPDGEIFSDEKSVKKNIVEIIETKIFINKYVENKCQTQNN